MPRALVVKLTRQSLRAIGLDVGLTTTKMVVVERRGHALKVVKAVWLDHKQEGLLSEKEVSTFLLTWLHDQGYRGGDVVLGLPQAMVMAQLADFPPGADDKLEDMVRYETQQLAGLSDESFLNGYRQTTPFLDHKNPVLLGVCRESMVRDRLKIVAEANVNVGDLVMEGEALALACRDLQKTESAGQDTVLLLDIGAENTTMVVLQAGQIAFVSSVQVGGENFTDAMARHLGVSGQEAERTKLTSRVIPSDDLSPVTRTAETLTSELLTALEHWRHQSGGEHPEPVRFHRVYVAGGGALLGGLNDFLHDTFACPVHSLAVPVAGQEAAGGRLVIAYGLALYALADGRRPAAVSFAPRAVRWAAKRRRRLPLAVLAVILLALTATVHLGLLAVLSESTRARLDADLSQLDQCRSMLPQLVNDQHQAEFVRGMLVPFASRANRNAQVYRALNLVNQACQTNDWLCLFADEASYRGRYDYQPSKAGAPSTPAVPMLMGGSAPAVDNAGAQYKPWKNFYVSGFTPYSTTNPLGTVTTMTEQLRHAPDGFLGNVDVVSDAQVSELNFSIRQPWMEYFGGGKFRPFTLRLPLKATEFNAEKVE